MKQIIRRVIDKKGDIRIEEIPTPHMGDNQVLISTHYSLISSGTELGEINKNPLELAKLTLTDPWMRNAVKDLIFSGGITETWDTITNELFLYRMIGYSGSGIVLDEGKNVQEIRIGDRVAFAAQGHAEQVSAYAHHVVKVPESVDLKEAAFVTMGAIALQGIRRSQIQIGEWVVVYGLGLIGQLTVSMLLANGARVIGIDLNEKRIALAENLGMSYSVNPQKEDIVNTVLRITSGKGADCSIICAVSHDPTIANNAMKMTRKQGRVVFVGIVKMDLERKPFFMQELDISFSRAYGPGSYDEPYEKGRIDYPYHYVRWTEKRNLEEVIRLIAERHIHLEPLIDSIYPLEASQHAFDKIKSGTMNSVAVLLSYSQEEKIQKTVHTTKAKRRPVEGTIRMGVIGTGNFCRNVHIPNLSRIKGYSLRAVCSASGLNAASLVKRFSIDYTTTDYQEILKDKEIDAVLIATRHDLHTKIAVEAAQAGKNIFFEKPVAMTPEELQSIEKAIAETGVHLMIGYNRRYSPIVAQAKRFITQQPIMMKYTVNIKNLPDAHWTLDEEEGGGRLLGEAEHFFDLMNFFAHSRPFEVQAVSCPITSEIKTGLFNFMVQVKYENNTLGQLMYTSLGGPKLPRENIEIFCGDRHLQIIDFQKLLVNQHRIFSSKGMGYHQELQEFLNQLQKMPALNPQIFDAASVALQANEILRRG